MNIVDREVIKDLLPLYRSGLASAATRALVESHLAYFPELKLELPDIERPADASEMRAFTRARSLLVWRRRLYGTAIGLTVVSFTTSMRISENGISNVHLLALDLPWLFGPVVALAAIAWFAYFRLKASSKL